MLRSFRYLLLLVIGVILGFPVYYHTVSVSPGCHLNRWMICHYHIVQNELNIPSIELFWNIAPVSAQIQETQAVAGSRALVDIMVLSLKANSLLYLTAMLW